MREVKRHTTMMLIPPSPTLVVPRCRRLVGQGSIKTIVLRRAYSVRIPPQKVTTDCTPSSLLKWIGGKDATDATTPADPPESPGAGTEN
jgi:hypothetical protein